MTFSFMTDVAVSPTTFHFHTPSLVKAISRVRSKIRTANAYVRTAVMRALRPQRSVKQTHSLMQTLLQLWKKTLGMVTIMGITMVMAMATMGTTRVLVPVVSAMAMTMTTTMVITMEIMMAMTMDKVKVSKVLDNKG